MHQFLRSILPWNRFLRCYKLSMRKNHKINSPMSCTGQPLCICEHAYIYQSSPQPGDHRGQGVNLQRTEGCMKHHQCHQDTWPQRCRTAGGRYISDVLNGCVLRAFIRLHICMCLCASVSVVLIRESAWAMVEMLLAITSKAEGDTSWRDGCVASSSLGSSN